MSKIKNLSSRVLSMFVTDVAAGACDPRTGHCCSPNVVCAGRKRSCAGHCYYSGDCPRGDCN